MTQTDELKRTRITGVGTVGIPVSDADRSLEFYTKTLGFEVRRDLTFGVFRWIEVAPPGATTTVALAPHPEGTPIGVETGIRLFTEDADADHASLLAQGVKVDPEVTRTPGIPPMFTFRDPDGNKLYVVGHQ